MDTPRVLIADDDAGIREALTDLLTEEGMEVVGAATDGREAVQLVTLTRPDVVLMDLRMPVMDGITATRHIREEAPLVQVVMLSAYDDPALTHGAEDAGAYAYLIKGSSASLVGDVVNQAYSLKKGLEARERSA